MANIDDILLTSRPLLVDAALATKVGLEAALVLMVINNRLQDGYYEEDCYDDKVWTGATVRQLQSDMKWLTVQEVADIHDDLEQQGLIETATFYEDGRSAFRLTQRTLDLRDQGAEQLRQK